MKQNEILLGELIEVKLKRNKRSYQIIGRNITKDEFYRVYRWYQEYINRNDIENENYSPLYPDLCFGEGERDYYFILLGEHFEYCLVESEIVEYRVKKDKNKRDKYMGIIEFNGFLDIDEGNMEIWYIIHGLKEFPSATINKIQPIKKDNSFTMSMKDTVYLYNMKREDIEDMEIKLFGGRRTKFKCHWWQFWRKL